MWKKLSIGALAFILASCSALPFDFGASAAPEPQVCPTCVAQQACSSNLEVFKLTPAADLPVVLSVDKPTPAPVKTKPPKVPSVVKTKVPLSAQKPSEPTPESTSVKKPYSMQKDYPKYLKNFTHPEKGCGWFGVAGQVFGAGGAPQTNLVVVVSGVLGERTIDAVGLTGLSKDYGPGGYEIELGNRPAASTMTLSIQVFDNHGNALTNSYPLTTFKDCGKNLVLVNFDKNF